MMMILFQSALKFVFIRFFNFISNISLMFNQGSVLFTMSASVLARLLKQDLNHQLCGPKLKQAVTAPHTFRLRPVQDTVMLATLTLA